MPADSFDANLLNRTPFSLCQMVKTTVHVESTWYDSGGVDALKLLHHNLKLCLVDFADFTGVVCVNGIFISKLGGICPTHRGTKSGVGGSVLTVQKGIFSYTNPALIWGFEDGIHNRPS